MEDFKGRAKVTVIAGRDKVIFSARRKTAQIITPISGVEIRANKLAGGFRFRADGFRAQEFNNDQLLAAGMKVILVAK